MCVCVCVCVCVRACVKVLIYACVEVMMISNMSNFVTRQSVRLFSHFFLHSSVTTYVGNTVTTHTQVMLNVYVSHN